MNFRWHICPLVLVAVFASCSPVKSGSTNQNASKEYETIISDRTILWSDCLKQEEADYLVFIYSKTCLNCHEIMGDVTEFCLENIINVYFVDKANKDNEITICPIEKIEIGINDIDKLEIAGTPTLLRVNEGIVTANVAGKDPCLTFLNEIRLIIKNKNTIA